MEKQKGRHNKSRTIPADNYTFSMLKLMVIITFSYSNASEFVLVTKYLVTTSRRIRYEMRYYWVTKDATKIKIFTKSHPKFPGLMLLSGQKLILGNWPPSPSK
jgi:hypothetical protein